MDVRTGGSSVSGWFPGDKDNADILQGHHFH
jgi:hypothetical protein